MLTTVGLVILAVAVGAFLGLVTAWPAWTREARQRYVEAMVARGEFERQSNRITFLEGRVREREAEIKHLEAELDAKDLLNEGLKIGMAQLRDRLSDAERDLTAVAARHGVTNGGDRFVERLQERVEELEPLTLQVAERDLRIRQLESLESELEEWRDRLRTVEERHLAVVAAKSAEVDELQRRVGELEPLIEQMTESDHAGDEVATLKADVEARNERIRRLGEEHGEALSRKDAKIKSLRQRVATLEPLVARLTEREAQLEELEVKLREFRDEQRRVAQEHRLAVATREAQVEDLHDRVVELEPLRERLADREQRIRELEFLETQLTELEELEHRLREREAKLHEIEKQHGLAADDKDQEIIRLRQRIGELAPLAERLERRDARIRDLERAVEAQRVTVDTMRQEAAAGRAMSITVGDVQELRRQLGALEEECSSTVGAKDAELATLRARIGELEDLGSHQRTALRQRTGELERLRKRLAHLQPRPKGVRGRVNLPPAAHNAEHRRDNLKRIRGIGPALERKLNDLGCYTFQDIAGWEGAEIERVARQVRASPKRIKSEWVTQAREYATRRSKRAG